MDNESEYIEVIKALTNEDIYQLCELYNKDKNLFKYDFDRRSTLHIASQSKNLQLLTFLLECFEYSFDNQKDKDE